MKLRQLTILSLSILALAACQKNQEPSTHVDAAYEPLPQQGPDNGSSTDVYPADPYAGDPLITSADTTTTPVEAPPPPARNTETTLIASEPSSTTRTHIIERGDTLYALARKYYGDQRKWKTIWEANRTRVPHRDKLQVGTKLIIP